VPAWAAFGARGYLTRHPPSRRRDDTHLTLPFGSRISDGVSTVPIQPDRTSPPPQPRRRRRQQRLTVEHIYADDTDAATLGEVVRLLAGLIEGHERRDQCKLNDPHY